MTLLQRIENFRQTWVALIPHIVAPPSEDIARWCNYPDSAIELAIMRTAKRFAASKINSTNFNAIEAYRYTTSTAKSISGLTI